MFTRLEEGLVAAIVCALAAIAHAQPLSTAFSYQGELRNAGAPASGLHDLRFRLYDAPAGGAQVGGTLCSDNVAVTNGRFTVLLDFGAQFAGQQRFLEIEVRADTGLDCASAAGLVLLAPRQALSATPNAAFALNAATATSASSASLAINATQLNGQGASFYQNASNLSAGTIPDARLSGTYSSALSLSNAGNTINGTHAGSGAALTALNASNIGTGTLASARLPNPLTLAGSVAGGPILSGTNSSTGGAGVLGRATAAIGEAYGVRGESDSPGGIGVYGLASAPGATQAYGVWGQSHSTIGAGVFGMAVSTTGSCFGVAGVSGSPSGYGVGGENTSPIGAGAGVWGLSAGTYGRGVSGYAYALSGDTHGVFGQSRSTGGTGVSGLASASSGITYGVRGESASSAGIGVYGLASAGAGGTYGVWGQTHSTDGTGVVGAAVATEGFAFGVTGSSASPQGTGVYGVATSPVGGGVAVRGVSASPQGTGVYGYATNPIGGPLIGDAVGVRGVSDATQGYAGYFRGIGPDALRVLNTASGRGMLVTALTDTALWATTDSGFAGIDTRNAGSAGMGLYALASSATGTTYGVYGRSDSAAGWGLWAQGRSGASGTKSFRIDHPADPENRYLLHYSTESPEVLNAYSGKVTLDGAGEAIVELPAYFARVNKDPRYMLTAVGAPMPLLHVAEEISEADLRAGELAAPGDAAPICFFRIRGGAPGGRVSWRIEALRNDLWMRNRAAPVEADKEGPERGTYQHPEFYGQPIERSRTQDPDQRAVPAPAAIGPR